MKFKITLHNADIPLQQITPLIEKGHITNPTIKALPSPIRKIPPVAHDFDYKLTGQIEDKHFIQLLRSLLDTK